MDVSPLIRHDVVGAPLTLRAWRQAREEIPFDPDEPELTQMRRTDRYREILAAEG